MAAWLHMIGRRACRLGASASCASLHMHIHHAQELAFGPQPGFPTEGAGRMFSDWGRQLQKETDALQACSSCQFIFYT